LFEADCPDQPQTRCPPKAEVTGSNPVGRANQINDLSKIVRKRQKAKLTTNSPTKRLYWRVIGDHSATVERRALFVLQGIITADMVVR
jgi:hypothetical protein